MSDGHRFGIVESFDFLIFKADYILEGRPRGYVDEGERDVQYYSL